MDGLFEFEYQKMGIPAPAVVVYLRVDPALSQKLIEGRYQGNAEKKDIHEKDVEYLYRSRQAADYCAAHLGWQCVDCACDGAMRPPQEISGEIWAWLKGESKCFVQPK